MTAATTPARAVADVRVRGTDGRLYSARQLTPEQRDRAIDAAHWYCCTRGMTIRAAQQAMAEWCGIRRSTGAIHADLRRYTCDDCQPPLDD